MHPPSSEERTTAVAAIVLQVAPTDEDRLRWSSLDSGVPELLRVADSGRSSDPAGFWVSRFPQVAGASSREESSLSSRLVGPSTSEARDPLRPIQL